MEEQIIISHLKKKAVTGKNHNKIISFFTASDDSTEPVNSRFKKADTCSK
jgi:hypothetical protein